MRSCLLSLLTALGLTFAASGAAFAQGSFFTSLSGTVVDSSGGVIPGADVRITENGTGIENNTITASDGGLTIPSLPGGGYSVSVWLTGFKTGSLSAAPLQAARPAT